MQWIVARDLYGVFLFVLAVGLACGVFFRSFVSLPIGAYAFVVPPTLLCFAFWYLFRVERYAVTWLLAGLFLCAILAGILRTSMSEHYFDALEADTTNMAAGKEVVEGDVVSDVERRGTSQVFTFQFENGGGEHVRAEVRTESVSHIAYGDRVSVEGSLRIPKSFDTDLGRTFPYHEYLRARDTTYTMSFAKVETLRGLSAYDPRALLFSFKHRFIDSIELLISAPASGLAEGLLLGVRYSLPQTLEDVFRSVGIVHIIVLSGYNLSIVAEFLMRMLRPFTTPRKRLAIGAVGILLFAFMVGPSATVIRATIMALLVLLARATGNVYSALRALALSAIAMLLWNPYVLAFDPGFELSFLATLGLIICAPIIEGYLHFVPTKLGIREFMTATIATQIFVAPFLLYAMGNASLVFLFANILVLTVVPLTMLAAAIAALAGMLVGFYALPLAYIPYLLLSYIIGVADTLSRIPYASLTVPPFPFMYVVLAYAVIGAVVLYFYTKTDRARSARSAFKAAH